MDTSIDHPPHYADSFGGVECIEAIESSMSLEEFKGFLKGNVQKYVWRYSKKNGVEDLKKARWYLERLISIKEFEETLTKSVANEISEKRKKIAVNYDPDDYMASGCPDGFCPLPDVRQGPSETMFQPVS